MIGRLIWATLTRRIPVWVAVAAFVAGGGAGYGAGTFVAGVLHDREVLRLEREHGAAQAAAVAAERAATTALRNEMRAQLRQAQANTEALQAELLAAQAAAERAEAIRQDTTRRLRATERALQEARANAPRFELDPRYFVFGPDWARALNDGLRLDAPGAGGGDPNDTADRGAAPSPGSAGGG